MTAITITDPALVEQLRRIDAVELRDPEGRVLGQFSASGDVPSKRPAYTRDDVRRFREQVEAARRKAEAEGVRPEELGRLPAGFVLPELGESRGETVSRSMGSPSSKPCATLRTDREVRRGLAGAGDRRPDVDLVPST